jgi:hypothetical protein
MMRTYHGPSRVTVNSISALYPQRVVVRPAGGAEIVLPGEAGATCRVEAERWELLLQHQLNGTWRENIRAIVGKWRPVGENGGQRQQIRSKDVDWPTDRLERNLIVTIERGDTGATRVRETPRTYEAPRVQPTQSTDALAAGSAARARTQSAAGFPTGKPASAPAADSARTGASAPSTTSTTSTSSDGYVW